MIFCQPKIPDQGSASGTKKEPLVILKVGSLSQ
jgi:hypothetical protein